MIADIVAGLNFLSLLGRGQGSIFLLIAPVLALVGLSKLHGILSELADPDGAPSTARLEREEIAEPLIADIDMPVSATRPRAALQIPTASQPVKSVESVEPAEEGPTWTEQIDWDEWVGKKLLQKAGIVIVLIGMLVFLKYSFDNHWIDELGRVALSTMVAVIALVAGELFQKKYTQWSQAFTGGGLALLYFTVWVAHVLYARVLAAKYGIVIPGSLALVLYSGITVVGALAAIRYNAQTIAWFAVAGGYLTPFLIGGPAGSQLTLILYLAVLAGGMTLLAGYKRWQYMDTVAFLLTQLYLFGIIYTAPDNIVSDSAQIVTAVGFFALFTLLPLIRQFRLKQSITNEDIGLTLLNGVAVFLAVVDAVGGWGSGYVGIICLALAGFYLVCSAAALTQRAEDDRLVNLYLVGMIILVAGALLAEMKSEWVAAGWAPLSVGVMYLSVRVQRRGPWMCAVFLLIGSFLFLTVNLPNNAKVAHSMLHLFTSNWSLQSYVVFLSVILWQFLANKLPVDLQSMPRSLFKTYLHIALAALLFVDVTILTSQMDFVPNMLWTIGYILFTVVAIAVFFFTESLVWFAAACIVQMLSLLFIFGLGKESGLQIGQHHAGAFLAHAWGYISLLTLFSTFLILYVAEIKKNRFTSGLPIRSLLVGVALAQVWVHVSVEITNAADLYVWSSLFLKRALVCWWVAFSLCLVAAGILRQSILLRKAGIYLLVIPFIVSHLAILRGATDMFPDSMLWTVLSVVLCIIGARTKYEEILKGGMLLLAGTVGVDMAGHLGMHGAGLLRSCWWALTGLVTMIMGFMEREQNLRRLSMGIFAATVLKLLIFDFSALDTPVRIGASIATGLLMIAASYLYQRFDSMLPAKNS